MRSHLKREAASSGAHRHATVVPCSVTRRVARAVDDVVSTAATRTGTPRRSPITSTQAHLHSPPTPASSDGTPRAAEMHAMTIETGTEPMQTEPNTPSSTSSPSSPSSPKEPGVQPASPVNPDPKAHPIHPAIPTQPIHEGVEGTDPKKPVTPGTDNHGAK